MFLKSFASYVVLASLYAPFASAAVVSLYYPADDDGVPYTADPIGTDKSGHTTWRVALGTASGTFTATQTSFSPVTLVEGATDLHAFAEGFGLSGRLDCDVVKPTGSNGVAVASCLAQLADNTSAITTVEPSVTLTPIPFQVPENFKSSGAEGLRMSLGGVAVSMLTVLGTAGAVLVRM